MSFVDNFDDECVGEWRSNESTVRIQTKGMSKDSQTQIFFHEALHAILDTYGHSDLSTDEEFVERISQGIYQLIKTAE